MCLIFFFSYQITMLYRELFGRVFVSESTSDAVTDHSVVSLCGKKMNKSGTILSYFPPRSIQETFSSGLQDGLGESP